MFIVVIYLLGVGLATQDGKENNYDLSKIKV